VAPIQTVAVVGAGVMGRGIAYGAALGGYRTILEDLLPNALRKAEQELRTGLDDAVKRGVVSATAAQAAFGLVEYAGSVEDAAREADFIIEAVPDELESKIEIFTLLDKICRPATVLASNTSWLSVSEIAGVTYRLAKCLGMRFVNPVHEMKVLQIVRTPDTDEETVAAAVELSRRMGMEALVVDDQQVSSPTKASI